MKLALRISGLVVALFCVARRAHADEAPTPPTSAEDVQEVEADASTVETRAHHRRGIELYDDGDFRLALVEFEPAYAISKNYKILFNIGQVHMS